MSRTREYAETIIDLIENRNDTQILGRIVLGGGEGPDGGSGLPWRTPIGQLNQRLVTYDTTEAELATTTSPSSLVDNLNHIRFNQKPARWFELTPTTPRSMAVNVNEGLWYYDNENYLDFAADTTVNITVPSVNPRLVLVYITASGDLSFLYGAESASPTLSLPADLTVSGIQILPLGLCYTTPETTVIGGYNETTYNGYLYTDMRPFIGGTGGSTPPVGTTTKTLFVPALGNDAGAARKIIEGVLLADNAAHSSTGAFIVPTDYVSDMYIYAIIYSDSSGDLYGYNEISYGACGEEITQHNDDSGGFDTPAITQYIWNCICEVSMTQPTAGDIVSILFYRGANSASDTVNDNVYIAGWKVIYEGS